MRHDGSRYCRLIRPFEDWTHWDSQAQKVHGISRQMLLDNGISGTQICKELNTFLGNSNAYCDGWVVDLPWLNKLYAQAGMQMSFRLSSLEMILKLNQMNVWHETKQKVEKSLNLTRHRASNDALIIQRTFEMTAQTH